MIWQDLPIRAVWHGVFHIAVPLLTAYLFYRDRLLYATTILLSGLLIDLDHLLVFLSLPPAAAALVFIRCIPSRPLPFMLVCCILRKPACWLSG